VNLPLIRVFDDETNCILSANKALTMATKRGGGPVHINLIFWSFTFNTPSLPDVCKIDFYQTEDLLSDDCISQLKNQLYGKKIALLIGAHRKFSKKETEAIEAFIDTYDVSVFHDIASGYHGKNKVLLSVASGLRKINIKPDIVIDIGSVTPVYSAPNLLQGVEFWRISEDGEFHQRYFGNLRKQFDCCENIFFDIFADKQNKPIESKYYHTILESMGKVIVPELPFSNIFVSSQFAQKLPENCSFHAGASESVSNMNFFVLKESIDSGANVGTLGIDGSISTLVGQSMVNKNKLYFGLVGDLTFFYDMNILGNRHIQNNIRLMLVNNERGIRFRVTSVIEERFGDETDELISAGGHNGSAEGWARSMGFEYLTAKNKKDFSRQIDNFCSPDINKFNKPVLFEVFTTVKDEQNAWELIRDVNK
jgi:2-succinyl-5-enolpyruvyl-6-hydroxy-3-cyclohexene-1-carboxylate synthase